jgi:hypothetical protein
MQRFPNLFGHGTFLGLKYTGLEANTAKLGE